MIVLGFEGQDDVLDTVGMSSKDPAMKSGAFGEAHQRCLLESGWGTQWAKHWAQNIERSPQLTRLYEDDSLVAFGHKELEEIHIIQLDGCRWAFLRRQSKKLTLTSHGWQLPITSDFNLELRNHEGLFSEIQNQLMVTGEFPIPELICRLNLDKRIHSPSALLNGRLIFKPDLKEYWSTDSIAVTASYAISVPDRIYNLWKECTEKLRTIQGR